MSDTGMFVEPDTFTTEDRALLLDVHGREQARTETFVRDVEDGTLVEGYEKREVFTFTEPSLGELCFDVHSIRTGIASGRIPAAMFRLEKIPEHFYQHVLTNNGVETERFMRLTARDLERPGIMVMWPNSENTTLIDGNHRMCRRYQLDRQGFRFLLVRVADCAAHICRPGEEERLFHRERPGVEVLHTEIKVEE